jgi:hypothetical protein
VKVSIIDLDEDKGEVTCDTKLNSKDAKAIPKISLATTIVISQSRNLKLKGDKEEFMPKISLVAMTGITPQILKTWRTTKKTIGITILVDSRSTHNFIGDNTTKRLNLFVYPIKDLKVMVANNK